ncbi:MAG: helix-turn-helix domain-containing protein [Oligoflexia bacterium]|nr:helix-turn-helix domain-containing protein [Oligoflexia bacterium]
MAIDHKAVPIEWLSTNEAAKYLLISANALRIQVFRGQIKSYKLGRRLRFRLEDLRREVTASYSNVNKQEMEKQKFYTSIRKK